MSLRAYLNNRTSTMITMFKDAGRLKSAKNMSHGTSSLTQVSKESQKKTVRNDNVKVCIENIQTSLPTNRFKMAINGFATDRSKMSKELDCRVSLHLVSSFSYCIS